MVVLRILILVMCTCANAQAQTITTIAGTGRVEYSGDGGPATKVGINQPISITTDKYGCIYIVDAGYNIVRKVTTNGIISTIIGNYQEERIHPAKGFEGDEGPATNAVLWKPRSIIADYGNIYLGDFENSVIRKVNTAGLIHTVAGFPQQRPENNRVQQSAVISYANSDSSNTFRKYFADEHNNTVHSISVNGKISIIDGIGKAGYSGDGALAKDAELNKPWGVAEDSKSNIYIADTYNNAVRKVSYTGIITTFAGNGKPGYSGDGEPATSAQISSPHGIAADKEGNLYITDVINNVIRRVDTNGIISTFAGNGHKGYSGDGGKAANAQLNWPSDVAADAAGNIYIADAGNHVVRKVAATQAQSKKELKKEPKKELMKIPNIEIQKAIQKAPKMELQKVQQVQTQMEPQLELQKVPPIETQQAIQKAPKMELQKVQQVQTQMEPLLELQKLPQTELQKLPQVEPQKESLMKLQFVPELEPLKEDQTEIRETPKDAFSVIADPDNNELVVTTDSAAFTSFTITNTSGKVLVTLPLNQVKTNVNISFLPTGRYFLNLKNGDKVKTAMFVKEK